MTSRVSLPLIQALRDTARRLATEAPYQWGHMGSCNCGHLAQTVTRLTKAEIHTQALQPPRRLGAPAHGLLPHQRPALRPDHRRDAGPGLLPRRPHATSKSSATRPCAIAIPFERRNALRHNQRDDVVLYLHTWADLLDSAGDSRRAVRPPLPSPSYPWPRPRIVLRRWPPAHPKKSPQIDEALAAQYARSQGFRRLRAEPLVRQRGGNSGATD